MVESHFSAVEYHFSAVEHHYSAAEYHYSAVQGTRAMIGVLCTVYCSTFSPKYSSLKELINHCIDQLLYWLYYTRINRAWDGLFIGLIEPTRILKRHLPVRYGAPHVGREAFSQILRQVLPPQYSTAPYLIR